MSIRVFGSFVPGNFVPGSFVPEISSLEISLSILSSLFHYFFEITNETSEKYDKLLIGETILVLVINQYYCA